MSSRHDVAMVVVVAAAMAAAAAVAAMAAAVVVGRNPTTTPMKNRSDRQGVDFGPPLSSFPGVMRP